MNTPGVGPVPAAWLVGRVGRASRFATAAAFANYTGAAPVEIASEGLPWCCSRRLLRRWANSSGVAARSWTSRRSFRRATAAS
jgi:transposase